MKFIGPLNRRTAVLGVLSAVTAATVLTTGGPGVGASPAPKSRALPSSLTKSLPGATTRPAPSPSPTKPPTTTPPTTTPPKPAPANCGGVNIAKAEGGTWSCTFDDEFSATSLDTSKWGAYGEIAGGFRGGAECYDPANVGVAGGTLDIRLTKSATPFTCAGEQTQYRSGLVSTRGLFAQTYGRFEMRAKLPVSDGTQTAFWLLPENPYQPGGYSYGEIDVVETFGNLPVGGAAHLHYVATPGSDINGAYCAMSYLDTEFHTYTVEWNARTMTFLYDGQNCWTTSWKTIAGYQPAGATAPTPFDQRFYMIVNYGLGGTTANHPNEKTEAPSTMQVDYIRGWK